MADISVDVRGHMLGAGDFVFGDGSTQPVVTVPVVDPPVVQPPVVTQPPAGTADLPAVTTVWSESLDHGLGALSRAWGAWPRPERSWPAHHPLDAGQPGQRCDGAAGRGRRRQWLWALLLHHLDGARRRAWGLCLLWPATDVWPGPELDMIELLRRVAMPIRPCTTRRLTAPMGFTCIAWQRGRQQPHTYSDALGAGTADRLRRWPRGLDDHRSCAG